MHKKILVTGGLGYIGSHTAVALLQNGYNVIIADDLSGSRKEVLSRIAEITGVMPKFYLIDLKDKTATHQLFKENAIDGVIHFAAYKAVGESVQEPLKYYENNLLSLINILSAAEANGKPPVVFSSSCTVYGQADEMPITEVAAFKPCASPYGSTKQMCEQILKDVSEQKHIKSISLRYFNPVGAHNSNKIGELPLGVPNNLVPFITQTAIGLREQLQIFGNDYPTPDGTAVRDYIYIEDLAEAHLKAVKSLLSTNNFPFFRTYNVGTGKGYSVWEVVKAFEEVTGEKLNYTFAKRREGDVATAYADAKLAEKELEWVAKTSLHEALQTAWRWEQSIDACVEK